MPRVLTYDGNKFIGAYKFPDRKKPCLCIQEGANIVVYGTFNTDKGATEFMNKLGEFVGAIVEKESEDTE
jgi:hypothetical protein